MGVMTAPLTGSGVCPAWMHRVPRPCSDDVMGARYNTFSRQRRAIDGAKRKAPRDVLGELVPGILIRATYGAELAAKFLHSRSEIGLGRLHPRGRHRERRSQRFARDDVRQAGRQRKTI